MKPRRKVGFFVAFNAIDVNPYRTRTYDDSSPAIIMPMDFLMIGVDNADK